MGALDYLDGLKGMALDQAHIQQIKHSYELQEKNITQQELSISLLEKDVARLEKESEQLKAENADLKAQVAAGKGEAQFEIHDGFAFKKKADGTFEESGYCPNCKNVMGKTINKVYQCTCGHIQKAQTLPECIARSMNREAAGEGEKE